MLRLSLPPRIPCNGLEYVDERRRRRRRSQTTHVNLSQNPDLPGPPLLAAPGTLTFVEIHVHEPGGIRGGIAVGVAVVGGRHRTSVSSRLRAAGRFTGTEQRPNGERRGPVGGGHGDAVYYNGPIGGGSADLPDKASKGKATDVRRKRVRRC